MILNARHGRVGAVYYGAGMPSPTRIVRLRAPSAMICPILGHQTTIELMQQFPAYIVNSEGKAMADIERISAQQANTKTKSNQAMLVCAYEDEAKCRMLNLDGSISFTGFKSRVNSLPKSQEIIFY